VRMLRCHAPGRCPVALRKNTEKLDGSGHPSSVAHLAAVNRSWASSRLASRTTRSTMKVFAVRPVTC